MPDIGFVQMGAGVKLPPKLKDMGPLCVQSDCGHPRGIHAAPSASGKRVCQAQPPQFEVRRRYAPAVGDTDTCYCMEYRGPVEDQPWLHCDCGHRRKEHDTTASAKPCKQCQCARFTMGFTWIAERGHG